MSQSRLLLAGTVMILSTILAVSSAPSIADEPATPATAVPGTPGTAQAPAPAGPPATRSPKLLRDYGTVPTAPIEEHTSVAGKPDLKPLAGVWLLVAQAELVSGKFRNFPQIFKITSNKDGARFQLLDVKLPEAVEQAVKDANRKVEPWKPSPEILQTLKANWSTLPVLKEKYVDEFLYGKMTYNVVAPSEYPTVFAKADEELKKALEKSKLAFQIEEAYRPRDLGPDSRIAQMIARTTVYAVQSVSPDTVTGTQSMALIAVGAASPIPYAFKGPFVMYRLGA